MTHDAIRNRLRALAAPARDYRAHLRRLASSRRHVVFYGGGYIFDSGLMASAWREAVGRPVDFVCDRDSAKWGRIIAETPCIGPDDLFRMKDDCVVFLSLGDVDGAVEFLSARGIQALPFYKYDALANAGAISPEALETALDRMAGAYALLEDDLSRRVFETIAERVFRGFDDPRRMAALRSPDQYFPEGIVRLSPHEAFVDAGAFDGDTLRDFHARVNGRFDAYYAFELSRANHRKLAIAAAALPGSARIRAFATGLGEAPGTVAYREVEGGSSIGSGTGQGRIDALDRALAGKRATFIKMDIEGHEPDALRGAADTIRTQKPVMAVCVYHDPAHLWEIPLYLKSLVPEYRIYLRHHNVQEYETVCYAVAGERVLNQT